MTIHQSTIKLLKRDYPKLQLKGFQRAVCALVALDWRRESPSYNDIATYERDKDDSSDPRPIDLKYPNIRAENPYRYVPDAYLVDFNTQMLVAFEVEDHNKVSLSKLGKYYRTYLDILDPMGWGIALIGVDRWGSRRAIPYFDYLFADLIGRIPENSLLSAIQEAMAIEQEFAKLACEPTKKWDDRLMWDVICEARTETNHLFWRIPKAEEVFWTIHGRG